MEDAASPDSGYRSCSPHQLSFVTGCCEMEMETTKIQQKIEDPIAVDLPEEDEETLLSIEESKPASDWTNSDEKMPTCQNKTKESKDKIRNSRKKKAAKQLFMEEEENTSPVLGIRILPADQVTKASENENANLKGGAEKGAFTCRLCSSTHKDALSLAQHKCARIVNVKYDCPECGKSFSCPANLASHRRWHKPKQEMDFKSVEKNLKRRNVSEDETEPAPFVNLRKVCPKSPDFPAKSVVFLNDPLPSRTSPPGERIKKAIYPCPVCKRRFRRDSNRRKHAHVKHGIVDTRKPESRKASVEDDSSRGSASPGGGEAERIPHFRLPPYSSLLRSPYKERGFSPNSTEQPIRKQNSLSTLALAAATLNGDDVIDLSGGKPRPPSPDFPLLKRAIAAPVHHHDPNQPLDLSMKTGAKLRHSIDEITRPRRGTPSSPQVPSPPSGSKPAFNLFSAYPFDYLTTPQLFMHGHAPLNSYSLPWGNTLQYSATCDRYAAPPRYRM